MHALGKYIRLPSGLFTCSQPNGLSMVLECQVSCWRGSNQQQGLQESG